MKYYRYDTHQKPGEYASHTMNIVRVLPWGFSYSEAAYYGYRHCVHIGPWLIFFWEMP